MNKELFILAHKIADICHEYNILERNNPKHRWMEDRRKERVNAFYNQTESGLFLQMYYGLPSSLWTPLGRWGFGGSGSGHWDEVETELISRFGMRVHVAEHYRNGPTGGVYGPIYELIKVDNVILPQARVAEEENFVSYDDANEQWRLLTEGFIK